MKKDNFMKTIFSLWFFIISLQSCELLNKEVVTYEKWKVFDCCDLKNKESCSDNLNSVEDHFIYFYSDGQYESKSVNGEVNLKGSYSAVRQNERFVSYELNTAVPIITLYQDGDTLKLEYGFGIDGAHRVCKYLLTNQL